MPPSAAAANAQRRRETLAPNRLKMGFGPPLGGRRLPAARRCRPNWRPSAAPRARRRWPCASCHSAWASAWLSPSAALKRRKPSAAQRSMPALREVALDGRELERQRRHRPGQAGERLDLEALDVELDEGGQAMAFDQGVERGQRHAHGLGPALILPARRAVGGLDEGIGGGRHRRIGEIELELDRSRRRVRPPSLRSRRRGRGRRAACSVRASAGCGSTATTRAPSRRNAATRSPTWAPTSNTRSSGCTNWR